MDQISRRTAVLGLMAAPFLASDRYGAALAATSALPPMEFSSAGIADLRTWASSVSGPGLADLPARKAFIKRKALTAYTQPTAAKEARLQAAQQIALKGRVPLQAVFDPPTPGGVGYGAIFTDSFRALWGTGTAIIFTIVCPYRPGGNVDTWLYLTAANRSALGVEAFVSYFAQDEPLFKVFDWAQVSTDPWRLAIPLSWLGPYTVGDGSANSHRMLTIWNSTYSIGGLFYRNEVFLYNYLRKGWDLFYQYDYGSDDARQRAFDVGWWGPIVETFQPLYSGTNPMGFKKTLIAQADTYGRWSDWALLKPANSTIRTDNLGFEVRNIAENFAFIVVS